MSSMTVPRYAGPRALALPLWLLLLLAIAACAPAPEPTESSAAEAVQVTAPAAPAAGDPALFADATVDQEVTGKWARSCALCHITGEANAPRMGVAADWEARLAQGEEGLMKHTIEGLNYMPPLGYCMACEREDFRAIIKMMIGGGQ